MQKKTQKVFSIKKEKIKGTPSQWIPYKRKLKRGKAIKVFPDLETYKDETLEITMIAGFHEAKVSFKWRALEYFVDSLLKQQAKKTLKELNNIIEVWRSNFGIKKTWPKDLHPFDVLDKHIFPKLYELKLKEVHKKYHK